MTDTNHTDRSNLGQIEKKLDLSSTETQQTDSVEAAAKKIYDAFPYDEAGVKPRWQPNGNSNMQERARAVARHILVDCQAQTSQQVEEAVLQADATGAYHSGYLAGKAEVEEAVRIDENTSDGYHTFKELYEFRLLYNAHLFNEWAKQGMYDVHKSQRHNDGELCFGRDDYFVVVATLPTGQISNHYPMSDWDLFQCEAVEKAKAQWDGHTSQDVAQRLRDTLTPNHQD